MIDLLKVNQKTRGQKNILSLNDQFDLSCYVKYMACVNSLVKRLGRLQKEVTCS